MATEPRIQVVKVASLFEPNGVLNILTREAVDHDIAATSIIAKRISSADSWDRVFGKAVDFLLTADWTSPLKSRACVFLGVSDGWRPSNSVVLRKRFWGLYQALKMRSSRREWPEVEFRRGSEVRFGAAAEIRWDEIPVFGEWIRSTQCGLLVFDTSPCYLTPGTVQRFFSVAFDNRSGQINWSLAARAYTDAASVLVRCTGSFDDAEAAVDLIYNPRFVVL